MANTCEEIMNGEGPFKLFDFSDEAVAVFESMKSMRRVGVNYVAELYRGQLNNKRTKAQVF